MKERIAKMSLETSLWADMLDCFVHGTRKEFNLAERRYYRFVNRNKKRK